jgi:hypothetical protein
MKVSLTPAKYIKLDWTCGFTTEHLGEDDNVPDTDPKFRNRSIKLHSVPVASQQHA